MNPDVVIPIVMSVVGLLLAAAVIAAVIVVIRKYFTTKHQEIGSSNLTTSDVRDIRQALIDNATSQQIMVERLTAIEQRINTVEKTLTDIP